MYCQFRSQGWDATIYLVNISECHIIPCFVAISLYKFKYISQKIHLQTPIKVWNVCPNINPKNLCLCIAADMSQGTALVLPSLVMPQILHGCNSSHTFIVKYEYNVEVKWTKCKIHFLKKNRWTMSLIFLTIGLAVMSAPVHLSAPGAG